MLYEIQSLINRLVKLIEYVGADPREVELEVHAPDDIVIWVRASWKVGKDLHAATMYVK